MPGPCNRCNQSIGPRFGTDCPGTSARCRLRLWMWRRCGRLTALRSYGQHTDVKTGSSSLRVERATVANGDYCTMSLRLVVVLVPDERLEVVLTLALEGRAGFASLHNLLCGNTPCPCALRGHCCPKD